MLFAAVVLFAITRVENWGWTSLTVIAALFGVRKDMKGNLTWDQFLPPGLIAITLFFLIYKYANPLWHQVIGWQTQYIQHIFQWNEFFDRIPLNDGAIFRFWQPEWLTEYMKWVYSYGFALSYWICLIYSFFSKDVKKLLRYALAGYLLQVPLILPFYNTILLQEVWYVHGVPDMLQRMLTPEEAFRTAWNCFPSMHTSIAFAGLLLSRREKNPWFRLVAGIYCGSIILSTLYLQIHWVLDVIGGMIFAYCCVKLADWIIDSKKVTGWIGSWERLGVYLSVKFGNKNHSLSSPGNRKKANEETG